MPLTNYLITAAKEMGIPALRVTLVNGARLGCTDMHLANLESSGYMVSLLIRNSEVKTVQEGEVSADLQQSMQVKLLKLKRMIEADRGSV